MFVNAISIRREGYYGAGYSKVDHSKPFAATIEVQGQHGKIELSLSADMSRRIVEIIADEVVAAGRATAEAMTADIFTAPALTAA